MPAMFAHQIWQADLSRALQIDGRDAELLYRRGDLPTLLVQYNSDFTALGDLEGQTLT